MIRPKPGRRNSDERLTRVGARLESRIQNGERQKIVFETLRKEFAAMRKSAEGIEAAFDHDFTNKSFINILEKYRKRLEDGHKQLAKLMNNKEAYYLVRSQTTKVKVTPSKLKVSKNHSS